MSTASPSLFLNTFEITKCLGSGSFGVVYQVTKKEFADRLDVIGFENCGDSEYPVPQYVFAIKVIPKGRVSEAGFIAELCHPHIVSLFNVWAEDGLSTQFKELPEIKELMKKQKEREPDSSCSYQGDTSVVEFAYVIPPFLLMQFELCTEGSLDKYLDKTNRPFISNGDPYRHYLENRNLFTQIVEALVFMEIKEIVHGDLKLDNIFLTRRPNGNLIAKIGDFGLTSPIMAFTSSKEPKNDSEEAPTEEDIKAAVDSRPNCQSPEQAKIIFLKKYKILASGATTKTDIYSLGLIFIPMLVQFKSAKCIKSAIFDAKLPEQVREYPKGLIDNFGTQEKPEFTWIQKMVDHDPKNRPSAWELQNWAQDAGYKIEYGSKTPKQQLLNMLNLIELVADQEIEELDDVYKGFGHRIYYHLLELVNDSLISLEPDDEVLLSALRHLHDIREAPESSSKDQLYIYRKYMPLLEASRGLEDVLTLEFLLKLGTAEFTAENDSRASPGVKRSLIHYNRIRGTETFKGLDLLHPIKALLEIFTLMQRFGNFPQVGEEQAFQPEELEEAYQKAKTMYTAMIHSENGENIDELQATHARGLHFIQTVLLTRLGRVDEAEEMFHQIMQAGHEDSANKETVLVSYCKFLSSQSRAQEAIEIMEKLQKEAEERGDEVASKNALLHLIGFYYQVNHNSFENDDRWKGVMEKLHLKSDFNKAKKLLVDPSELQNHEVTFRVRDVDFEMLPS